MVVVSIAESIGMNPTQSQGNINRLRAIKVGSSSQFESHDLGNPFELAMSAASGRLLTDSLREVIKELQLLRRAVQQAVLEALLDCLPPTAMKVQANLDLHFRADHMELIGFSLRIQNEEGSMEHIILRALSGHPAAPLKVIVRSATTQTWRAVAWQAKVIQWLGTIPDWPELVRALYMEIQGRLVHKLQALLDQKDQIEMGIQQTAAQWSQCAWELLQTGKGYSIQSDEVTPSTQLDHTPEDEFLTGPYLELQIDRLTRSVVSTLHISHLSPSAKTCTVEGLRPALDLFESVDGLIPFKKSMRTEHLKATLQAHVLTVWSGS